MPNALAALAISTAGCLRCSLASTRTHVVFGAGDPNAELMFVGEAPGAEEDRSGLPFVGRSGKLLDQLVGEELGLARDQVYVANVVKCRPPDNRDPLASEIHTCRGYLDQQIELVAPRVVVTLGRFAGQLLAESTIAITKLRGRAYAFGASMLVPMFHPAYALRAGAGPLCLMRSDFGLVRDLLAEPSPQSNQTRLS
ncbi:MAG: uracil-DNA glycosylase [Actinomycetes bacterium]